MPSSITENTALKAKISTEKQILNTNDFVSSLYVPYQETIGGCTFTATPDGYRHTGKPQWKIEVITTDGRKAVLRAPLKGQFTKRNFTEGSLLFNKLNNKVGGALSSKGLKAEITTAVLTSYNLGGLITGTANTRTIYGTKTPDYQRSFIVEAFNKKILEPTVKDIVKTTTLFKQKVKQGDIPGAVTTAFGYGADKIRHSGTGAAPSGEVLYDSVGVIQSIPLLLKTGMKDIELISNMSSGKEKVSTNDIKIGAVNGAARTLYGTVVGSVSPLIKQKFPGLGSDYFTRGKNAVESHLEQKYEKFAETEGVNTGSSSYTVANHTVQVIGAVGAAIAVGKIAKLKTPERLIEPNVPLKNLTFRDLTRKTTSAFRKITDRNYSKKLAQKLTEIDEKAFQKGSYPALENYNNSISSRVAHSAQRTRWLNLFPHLSVDQVIITFKELNTAALKAGLKLSDVEHMFQYSRVANGTIDPVLAFQKAFLIKEAIKLSGNPNLITHELVAKSYMNSNRVSYAKFRTADEIVGRLNRDIEALKNHFPQGDLASLQDEVGRYHVSREVAAVNQRLTRDYAAKLGYNKEARVAINRLRVVGNTTPELAVEKYIASVTRKISTPPVQGPKLPTSVVKNISVPIQKYKVRGERPVLKYISTPIPVTPKTGKK